ncbi:NAD(P)-binding protein [bacterium LRH843]|nr:NAD(P)-binding protein [bacterium LRH843]
MNIHADVCIVGGGPAGALLGYLLAQEGVSTVILERSEGGGREFRGEHINAETEKLLKIQNLYEKVEEYGLLKTKRLEYFIGDKIVKTITPAPGTDHVGIHIPQTHLLRAINEKSNLYSHHRLLLKTTVTELIQNEEGFYTGVKAKRDGEELTVTSSVIVGADGRYSTVRKLANIPFANMKHGYDVLWAKIPAPSGWDPTTRMLLIDGHQLALFTQTHQFIQIGWNIEQGSFSSLKKKPIEPFLAPLIESFPELREIVLQHLTSWRNFVYFNVQSSRCDTWVKDGLVVIGDAAHTMTPTGAIGVNCAMKDAHVLAPIITEALREKNTSAKQLRKFEEMRRSEIEEQQVYQIKKEASFTANFS